MTKNKLNTTIDTETDSFFKDKTLKQNKKNVQTEIASKAFGKNTKISTRKIGLMLDSIRGNNVKNAQNILTTLGYKKSSVILSKILKSAIANAVNNNKYKTEDVEKFIIEGWIGKGMMLKRIEPRARGSSNRITREYSNVWLNLLKEVK